MRKLVIWVMVLVILVVPGYWVYSGNIPTVIRNTEVGRLIDDLSWKLNTYLALRANEHPEQAVEAFYGAIQEQDFYKVESYIDPAVLEYFNGDLLKNTNTKVDDFQVTEIQIRKDKARIRTIINDTQNQSMQLRKEKDNWLVQDCANLLD